MTLVTSIFNFSNVFHENTVKMTNRNFPFYTLLATFYLKPKKCILGTQSLNNINVIIDVTSCIRGYILTMFNQQHLISHLCFSDTNIKFLNKLKKLQLLRSSFKTTPQARTSWEPLASSISGSKWAVALPECIHTHFPSRAKWNNYFFFKKTGCAHQSPSCFLGLCHPGKNSPASQPGGPRSRDPGMHPPPGQTGCPELKPAREEEQLALCRYARVCVFGIQLAGLQMPSASPSVCLQRHPNSGLPPPYLQLAVVQAGHRNLLHFHLPELPDEQTLLWSCCNAAGIGQKQGCKQGRGTLATR